MKTESEVLNAVMIYLSGLKHIRFWRNNTGAIENKQGRFVRFGLAGSADIIGLIAPTGRLLAVEVKSSTGKQSEQQKSFQTMIEKYGGKYLLVRGVENLKELDTSP